MNQALLAYVGAVAGIIGAVVGIAGAIIAYLAFRRVGRLKSLDLRLELRRNEAALHSDIAELGPLLDRAKASYTHLAAARGSYRSGATEHWLSEWATDKTNADELVTAAAAYRSDCTAFSQSQLEASLAAVHQLHLQITKLTDKYRSSLATDDAGRAQLAADRRVVTQARLEGKA